MQKQLIIRTMSRPNRYISTVQLLLSVRGEKLRSSRVSLLMKPWTRWIRRLFNLITYLHLFLFFLQFLRLTMLHKQNYCSRLLVLSCHPDSKLCTDQLRQIKPVLCPGFRSSKPFSFYSQFIKVQWSFTSFVLLRLQLYQLIT